MIVVFGACVVGTVLLLLGVREFVGLSTLRRSIARVVLGDETTTLSRTTQWDRRFRRSRIGGRIERELILAGVDRPPLVVAGGAAASTVVVSYVLWSALAPLFGVASAVAGYFGLRAYLSRARARRREAFIAQMPQLARLLANAVHAGKAIPAAVAMAAAELDEPARSEMQYVADRLDFGASIEDALDEVRERLPSREVAVLVSTLVVCARSGGSLVSSLRDIASTLEDRKEVRREVRTILAQALFTGYLVVAMAIGLLFLLNGLNAGTVDEMTRTLAGRVALLVAFSLFGVGLLAIRQQTRIDP